MKLYDYLGLLDEDQWNYLWEHGVFIDSYGSIDHKFVLYSVDRFYIEVELCPVKENPIGKVAFKYGPRLEKYLVDFDV